MSDLDRPAPRRFRGIPPRFQGPVFAVWAGGWITAFALHQPEIGLPMLFLTGALGAAMGRGRRARRPPRADRWRVTDVPATALPAPAVATSVQPAPPAPERALVAAVLRAETNASRFDPDALALIRELEGLLRPMLAQLRTRGGDPAVRHDVEAIAAEHLPATLDAYLALPAHEPIGPDGSTPADVLRSQLTLLVEGCTQLRDALRETDVRRQQELSRFLEDKFRRGDLDLG